MSGLQSREADTINGLDVREQGSSLRVASNTPHLVSLGTGRLSTAVTLHPIKQGRVMIGSDPTCDIYVVGTGVASVHCRVENSHGVVTLYPTSGSTLLNGLPVEKPTRLSQGSMLTIGRSYYLRFNHPEEAKLMKSVLPAEAAGHVSMASIQFTPNEQSITPEYQHAAPSEHAQPSLSQLEVELDCARPAVPKKPNREQEGEYNLGQESKPKVSSIMAKVSKFEYYAKQQKSFGRSQFYTTHENEISPKVFSSNSLTVNTPAKDVLGGKNMPNYIRNMQEKVIQLSENNSVDPRNCSYQNFAIRNKNEIEDVVRNFDDKSRLPKKVNNHQQGKDNSIYGKIKVDTKSERNNQFYAGNNNSESQLSNFESTKNNVETKNNQYQSNYGKISDRNVNNVKVSSAFGRNPQYSPVYTHYHVERSSEAEHRRARAYQDRIKEEEQKVAETARLEEILNMCAEYERQIASGIPVTSTEKRAHSKIITNGSLPRSVALTNPNFVQTSEGYYKFDTSPNSNISMSQSLPVQRNLSHYENLNWNEQPPAHPLTPEVTIKSPSNCDTTGRIDEIGIPVSDGSRHDLSSPIMIRKILNGDTTALSSSPVGSPYQNVYYNRNNYLNLKPKSPNTQSPRSRIKTTFAHKNVPSPQYFVFPTPPPKDNSKPNFNLQQCPTNFIRETEPVHFPKSPKELSGFENANHSTPLPPKDPVDTGTPTSDPHHNKLNTGKCGSAPTSPRNVEKTGIEKQLSLEEEIPMIDDADLTDDIEFRVSRITEKSENVGNKQTEEKLHTQIECNAKPNIATQKLQNDYVKETRMFIGYEKIPLEKLTKNKSFDDVKKELMADIPELEEFEKDLKESKGVTTVRDMKTNLERMDVEADCIDSLLDENLQELKGKYERLREERKKLLTEIHEIKCKMTEIRSQEDDILRELQMEKALIKGEYDSEIAILNIEQKKRAELTDRFRSIEEDIKQLKNKQEARQNEMRDRVEIATLKVERIEKDVKASHATLDELQNAHDILDNETKMFEDLEFQHLEQESELLANREDVHNEVTLLSKRIDSQKQRILTLKYEANDNLTSALDETKVLQAEYLRLLNHVEHLTSTVHTIEKELKPLVSKLNEIERTQSLDSAFFTDQTRAKSGDFAYSQSSDSDDQDLARITQDHDRHVQHQLTTFDKMSQSMILDIERRLITDIVPINILPENGNESPTKTTHKEKKGFWERNFDSLKRKKKPKSPDKNDKTDIMSQSLNENMFYNNEAIENNNSLDRFNSLRHSKNKKEKNGGPIKSNSSSKIPTFAALGKIIKKDSFGKKSRENTNITIHNHKNETNEAADEENIKNRYVKNVRPSTDNKYVKAKSLSPDIELSLYEKLRKTSIDNMNNFPKMLHRKSCGDEPYAKVCEFQKMSDSGKIPSQDDIDRISKVTMDAPLLSSDTDINSLGKRTLDSLMQIERKRMEMLEEQGCQVIENEREKIIELKRRAQDETKKLWDQKSREKSLENDSLGVDYQGVGSDQQTASPAVQQCHSLPVEFEREQPQVAVIEHSSLMDTSFVSSSMFDDSSCLMSVSSIEELHVRHSRTESTEDDKRSDDSRPLSHASDFSRDNILCGGPRRRARGVAPYCDSQRPLTRYLPVDRDDFDLRRHVESAGHQMDVCPHVAVTATSCRGYLHKLGAKFHTWSKRWFVFDRETKTFVYYWDKSEKKPRGGAYFQVIEEVYLDHGNTSKSPSPQTTFIVKTRQRRYYLMAPSGQAARIWIEVIFTGAQGYTEYLE